MNEHERPRSEWTDATWNPMSGCTLASARTALLIPLRRKKPTTYFVSGLFHLDIPFDFIDKVFAVMALCPQHTFQVLTKWPERRYWRRDP